MKNLINQKIFEKTLEGITSRLTQGGEIILGNEDRVKVILCSDTTKKKYT
jgi:hypothetical protein